MRAACDGADVVHLPDLDTVQTVLQTHDQTTPELCLRCQSAKAWFGGGAERHVGLECTSSGRLRLHVTSCAPSRAGASGETDQESLVERVERLHAADRRQRRAAEQKTSMRAAKRPRLAAAKLQAEPHLGKGVRPKSEEPEPGAQATAAAAGAGAGEGVKAKAKAKASFDKDDGPTLWSIFSTPDPQNRPTRPPRRGKQAKRIASESKRATSRGAVESTRAPVKETKEQTRTTPPHPWAARGPGRFSLHASATGRAGPYRGRDDEERRKDEEEMWEFSSITDDDIDDADVSRDATRHRRVRKFWGV